jgi:hypothetical protein
MPKVSDTSALLRAAPAAPRRAGSCALRWSALTAAPRTVHPCRTRVPTLSSVRTACAWTLVSRRWHGDGGVLRRGGVQQSGLVYRCVPATLRSVSCRSYVYATRMLPLCSVRAQSSYTREARSTAVRHFGQRRAFGGVAISASAHAGQTQRWEQGTESAGRRAAHPPSTRSTPSAPAVAAAAAAARWWEHRLAAQQLLPRARAAAARQAPGPRSRAEGVLRPRPERARPAAAAAR